MALCVIVWHFSPGLAPQAGHSKSIGFSMLIVYPIADGFKPWWVRGETKGDSGLKPFLLNCHQRGPSRTALPE